MLHLPPLMHRAAPDTAVAALPIAAAAAAPLAQAARVAK